MIREPSNKVRESKCRGGAHVQSRSATWLGFPGVLRSKGKRKAMSEGLVGRRSAGDSHTIWCFHRHGPFERTPRHAWRWYGLVRPQVWTICSLKPRANWCSFHLFIFFLCFLPCVAFWSRKFGCSSLLRQVQEATCGSRRRHCGSYIGRCVLAFILLYICMAEV